MKYLLSDILRKECDFIELGQDNTCHHYTKRYVQKVVLINKDDVLKYEIHQKTDLFEQRHRIKFSLKNKKKAIPFIGNENGNIFFGHWSKTDIEGQAQYTHTIQMSILGACEESKLILKKLDLANYFAAVMLSDGVVEIYGFEFGLTTSDYDYDIQNNDGGSIIILSSTKDLLENEMPYIYKSLSGSEISDFENNFSNYSTSSAFNDDFNDDFNN